MPGWEKHGRGQIHCPIRYHNCSGLTLKSQGQFLHNSAKHKGLYLIFYILAKKKPQRNAKKGSAHNGAPLLACVSFGVMPIRVSSGVASFRNPVLDWYPIGFHLLHIMVP